MTLILLYLFKKRFVEIVVVLALEVEVEVEMTVNILVEEVSRTSIKQPQFQLNGKLQQVVFQCFYSFLSILFQVCYEM